MEDSVQVLLIGFCMFCLAAMGGVYYLMQMEATEPGYQLNSENISTWNSTFDQYSSLSTSIGGLGTSVQNASTDWGAFGALNSLMSTAGAAIKIIPATFNFADEPLKNGFASYGIPLFVAGIILLIISIIYLFGILNAIFKGGL